MLLEQLCGSSAVGKPEAVAQLIAEKMAVMNIRQGPHRLQDNRGEVLTLPAPAPADMAAPSMHVELTAGAQGCNTSLIPKAPALYDISGSTNSVQLAWSEWRHNSTTTAERVKQIKVVTIVVLGRRNSSLHKKNRHLPQLVESLIQLGAAESIAVSLVVQIAARLSFTLDQMRVGARLLAGHTAKQEHHTLTAATTITLGQY